ncbi:MAG: hypothetical protein NXI09_15745 [Bacteroidetes bacterium]|nr:hypothetical protein [Bacteroidota bacterium]
MIVNIFSFVALLILCSPSSYLVTKVDYSKWDNGTGVGIVWLENEGSSFKVLVHGENNFGNQLPQVSDSIHVALENFSFNECNIAGSVKWHPGANQPRCWSNLKYTVCPDTDSTFLYYILTDEELVRLKN